MPKTMRKTTATTKSVGQRFLGFASLLWTVVAFLSSSLPQTQSASDADDSKFHKQYEWVHGHVMYHYAHNQTLSLLTFDVPTRIVKVEFQITFHNVSDNGNITDVILGLRQGTQPVVPLENVSVSSANTLPKDQQVYRIETDQLTHTLTLESPQSGSAYLFATTVFLHDSPDVVQVVTKMDVLAVYTLLDSDVKTLDTDRKNMITLIPGQNITRSFRLPSFTTSLRMAVVQADYMKQTSKKVSPAVTLTVSESLYPPDPSSLSVDCSNQTVPCYLRVESPRLETEVYVTFCFKGNKSANFTVQFDVQGCESEGSGYYLWEVPGDMIALNYLTPQLYSNITGISIASNEVPVCVDDGLLGRAVLSSSDSIATFKQWTEDGRMVPSLYSIVPDLTTEVHALHLHDVLDCEGVLTIKATLTTIFWEGTIFVCAMPQRFAVNITSTPCTRGTLLVLDATSPPDDKTSPFTPLRVYNVTNIAYPTPGTWYISMQSQCRTNGRVTPCATFPLIHLEVSVTPCTPALCGQLGTCYECSKSAESGSSPEDCQCRSISGNTRILLHPDAEAHFTEEMHEATGRQSDMQMVLSVYLLTFTNLAFLPPIIMALRRRYFTLAAVFTYNMFFSIFFHVCVANPHFYICIMPSHQLSLLDSFAYVVDYWTILMTMCRTPEDLRTFLLVAGTLVIAATQVQSWEEHGEINKFVPIAVALVILAVSWGLEMRRRRALFPSKRRYLYFLLPGFVLAVMGGVVRAVLAASSNFIYGHSIWHLSMMLAPCLLMPPTPPKHRNAKPIIEETDDPHPSTSIM